VVLRRRRERHLDARHRHVGPGRDVLLEQQGVVERIDLVAGQHEHVLRLGRFDEIHVLIERVDRAGVPALAVALLCRPDLDVLPYLPVQESPPAMHVADQRLGLVLGEHRDAPQLRVDAVRQREVDRPIAAAERHRGLRLARREATEPASGAAREHERHRLVRPWPSASVERGRREHET
jgi:hypothetical protein